MARWYTVGDFFGSGGYKVVNETTYENVKIFKNTKDKSLKLRVGFVVKNPQNLFLEVFGFGSTSTWETTQNYRNFTPFTVSLRVGKVSSFSSLSRDIETQPFDADFRLKLSSLDELEIYEPYSTASKYLSFRIYELG